MPTLGLSADTTQGLSDVRLWPLADKLHLFCFGPLRARSGTPQSKSPGGKVELARNYRQGRRQVSRLFLPQVIAHVDAKRGHLDQRACCRVIGQFGRNISPIRGDQKMLLVP